MSKLLSAIVFLVLSCRSDNIQQLKDSKFIPKKVVKTTRVGANENCDDSTQVNYLLYNDYLVLDADINRDGLIDKVFCHRPYKGDELIFFISDSSNLVFKLKSINFSEDGGRILKSIEAVKGPNTVLKIKTYFPDSGVNEASYFIDYKKDWYLNKTIYKVSDWRETPAKNQICTLSQNLLLRNLVTAEGASKIKSLPLKAERSKLCRMEVP